MPSHSSWNRSSAYQDKFIALEEIQELLGLTHEEMVALIILFGKAAYGRLDFCLGDTSVELTVVRSRYSTYPEGSVRVETRKDGVLSVTEYSFPQGFNIRGKRRRV